MTSIDIVFIINSILLGVGLAMDAFSVSLANGLAEPRMGLPRMTIIAGTYGFFQFAMPMIGWFCVHTMIEYFKSFEPFVPWIALVLLLYIGGGMIRDARSSGEDEETGRLSYAMLFMQGVATSIDALSVGSPIAEYDTMTALLCSLIIAVVTFLICVAGLVLGKRFGMLLSSRAQILGGIILIGIGIEIVVSSFT